MLLFRDHTSATSPRLCLYKSSVAALPSAATLRPGHASAPLNAPGLSPRPLPAGVVLSSDTHPRMSGGKARGKKHRDTAAKDELLQLQALHHSHREATRLFLMAVREGATDVQIAHALRQGLPHLTAPASLQDRRAAGKEPEGTGTSEKGEQPAAQSKRTRTTSPAVTTQPALLAADGFAAALGALPPDDWSRNWAAGRTIMQLLERRPQWHGKGKAPVRSEATHIHVSAVPHHHTRSGLLCNYRTTCRVACRRSAGAVPRACAP